MGPTKLHPRSASSAAMPSRRACLPPPIKFSSNSTVTSAPVASLCFVITVKSTLVVAKWNQSFYDCPWFDHQCSTQLEPDCKEMQDWGIISCFLLKPLFRWFHLASFVCFLLCSWHTVWWMSSHACFHSALLEIFLWKEVDSHRLLSLI